MIQALALWHDDIQSSSLHTHELEWEGGKLLVRSAYSLISAGTEKLVASGQVPDELSLQMAVPYMEGDFSLPVKYGYSLVARVEKGPSPWVGRHVHLLHPHQSLCVVRPEDCTPLPEKLPLQRATLASNLETALNAMWDAGLAAGDRVLVVGFGTIGALLALLARRHPAVEVVVSETDQARRDRAIDLGFSLYDPTAGAFDLAFHASASAEGLQQCIDAVGKAGKVLEMSWYGKKKVAIRLGGSFHADRKQLISSQVSSLPAVKKTRWTFARRKRVVLELLMDDAWDALLDPPEPFFRSPDLFEGLRSGMSNKFSYLLEYTS